MMMMMFMFMFMFMFNFICIRGCLEDRFVVPLLKYDATDDVLTCVLSNSFVTLVSYLKQGCKAPDLFHRNNTPTFLKRIWLNLELS